jgi:hypothetical protein
MVFPSFAGAGYQLVIRSWSMVGASRITLNGTLVARSTRPTTTPPDPREVVLEDSNVLVIDMTHHSELTVEIRAPLDQPLPSCGPLDSPDHPAPLFERPLTPLDDLEYIIPLGHMEAPSHTLPTHHLYPTPRLDGGVFRTLDIFAPARARIVSVSHDPVTGNYDLNLRPCGEVRLYILHVRAISPRLGARLGPIAQWGPIPADYPASAFPIGVARTAIDVEAGELLGRFPPGPGGINYAVGIVDARRPDRPFVNPSRDDPPPGFAEAVGISEEDGQWLLADYAPDRLRQHCAVDYFVPLQRVLHEMRLGLGAHRTVLPLCGDHMRDAAGTAQGNWFEPPPAQSSTIDESRLMAFAPSVFDDRPAFSIGLRGATSPGSASSSPALAGTFVFYADGSPDASRGFNVHPGAVRPEPVTHVLPDGTVLNTTRVYCFDGLHGRDGSLVPGVLFAQMPDESTLRIQARQPPSASGAVFTCGSVAIPVRLSSGPIPVGTTGAFVDGGVEYVR